MLKASTTTKPTILKRFFFFIARRHWQWQIRRFNTFAIDFSLPFFPPRTIFSLCSKFPGFYCFGLYVKCVISLFSIVAWFHMPAHLSLSLCFSTEFVLSSDHRTEFFHRRQMTRCSMINSFYSFCLIISRREIKTDWVDIDSGRNSLLFLFSKQKQFYVLSNLQLHI